jgi:hypothetical protein
VALALALTTACASSPTDSGNVVTGAGGARGGDATGASGSTDMAPTKCPAGTNPKSAAKQTDVGLVSGQLVDEQGAPTSAGLVQICGRDICTNARVGNNGKLAEGVNQTLDAPACKFGDGLSWGKLAIPLESGDTELGTLTTVRLPDFADGVPFIPGTLVTSGGVTLALAKSSHVDIDTLTYENADQQGFRAAPLPQAALAQLKQDFVAGFALSPLETRICPSPALSLDNNTDLAAGAQLELFMQGLDVAEAWAAYGTWQKIGEGQVSDDGATLEFPDGVPLLTAIGVREKR